MFAFPVLRRFLLQLAPCPKVFQLAVCTRLAKIFGEDFIEHFGKSVSSPRYWYTSIGRFWVQPPCSGERKCDIFGQYWYTRNVPVFTNTGTFWNLKCITFVKHFIKDVRSLNDLTALLSQLQI